MYFCKKIMMKSKKIRLDKLTEGDFYTSNEPTDINRLISIGANTCEVFNYTNNQVYEIPSDVFVTKYDQKQPILQNIRFFLEDVEYQVKHNHEFSTAEYFKFSKSIFEEILGIFIIDPTKPDKRQRININGETVRITKELFFNVEYHIIGEELNKLASFFPNLIDTYEHNNCNKIQEVISYAFIEKMAKEYFHLNNIDTTWRSFHLNSVIELLNKNPEFNIDEFEKACEKLIPTNGPADTVGGELGRGIMKILYRIWNDGDDPTSYASASFWALINCWQIALENYDIYISSLPADRNNQEENRKKGQWKPDKLYISGELDPWMIIDLMHFFHHFIKTKKGKESNRHENGKPIWNIIEPHYERIEWYDKSVPYYE